MRSVDGIANEYSYSNGHKRADFERGVVSTLFKDNPEFNFVICEEKNTYNFTGKEHIDWDHQLVWYKGQHKSDYYNLVVGHQGEFCNHGDLRNWAYAGSHFTKDPHKPNCIDFQK